MTKVWLVRTCTAYEGCDLWGVFSSEDKATAWWREHYPDDWSVVVNDVLGDDPQPGET